MDNTPKLTALKVEQLVRLLKQAGSRMISEETLNADIENGAPQNDDGTINLIEYAAWLAKGDSNAIESE